MADTAPTASGALSEEAFEADRAQIWAWFTKSTRNAAIVVVVIVVLLALFVA